MPRTDTPPCLSRPEPSLELRLLADASPSAFRISPSLISPHLLSQPYSKMSIPPTVEGSRDPDTSDELSLDDIVVESSVPRKRTFDEVDDHNEERMAYLYSLESTEVSRQVSIYELMHFPKRMRTDKWGNAWPYRRYTFEYRDLHIVWCFVNQTEVGRAIFLSVLTLNFGHRTGLLLIGRHMNISQDSRP